MSLSRATFIKRALQLAGVVDAGVVSVPAGDIDLATDFLTMEIESLQDQGIVLQNIERATLSVLAGTIEYTLPTTTLNVFIGPDNIAGTMESSAGTETPVKALSRHEYTTGILRKDAQAAAPSHVYVEKTADVKVIFWPEPTEARTFHYQRVAMSTTMDGFRRWQKALCYAVAAAVAGAKSRPEAIVGRLMGQAKAERAMAKGADVELGPAQFFIPSSWGRIT